MNNDYKLPLEAFTSRETPFYFYDIDLLNDTLSAINQASNYEDFRVHYAVKACVNPDVLKAVAAAGLGADTVSAGEIKRAIDAGFKPESIVFAGVGKTDREINLALDLKIGCFNVESLEELLVINELAEKKGVTAPIALRVNPDIDAHTHHYITTGLTENKFGISLQTIDSVIDTALTLKGIELMGLHFHIGSQITINKPYELLCEAVNFIVRRTEKRGVKLRTINVGGGLGIDYDTPDAHLIPYFKTYFDIFRRGVKLGEGMQLHFELGRAVVAQCGSLISRVVYVKKGLDKNFMIIDAGMTELIRPALYQAHHHIDNLSADSSSRRVKYDVVGPICESSDVFDQDLALPEAHRGDIIAIRSAGAYGEIMSSHYNCRELNAPLAFSRR
jgi:diaminopimelate decarboxylase